MDEFNDLEFQKQRLLRNINSLADKEQEKIKDILEFAIKKHLGQERDEGTPYIIHPIRVANILIEELDIKNPDAISAALLHDVVEDTDVDLKEICDLFDEETGKLVKNLTRIKKPDETLENRYNRKLHKHKQIMKKNQMTRSIKACDVLDNMRSWKLLPNNHPSRKKFPRWFKETKTMYLPLAKSVERKIEKLMLEALTEAKKNS